MKSFPDYSKEERPVVKIDKELADKALEQLRALFRGNGLKPEDITRGDFDGEILQFEAYGLYKIESVISDKHVPGRAQGEIAGSYPDAQQRLKAGIERITLDKQVRGYAMDILKKREDIGVAVDNMIVNYERFNKTVVIHEPCAPCAHTGKIPCPNCRGKGQVPCIKCHGHREIHCHVCHGTQWVNTAQGRKQCMQCHGRGRIRCPQCHQTGFMQCPKCKATGRMPCHPCSGTGWNTRILHAAVKAKTKFTYDRDALPEEVPPLMDNYGPALVTENHAHARIIEDLPKLQEMDKLSDLNEFIIPYFIRLPWGEVDFKVKGQDVKAKIFGFNPALLGLPPLLEKTISGAVVQLKRAAEGQGNPGKMIGGAIRCRLIGETMLYVLRTHPKNAALMMQERYPTAIRPETLQHIAVMAKAALDNLTRKPRQQGLMIGAGITALLYALYFVGPLRALLVPLLGDMIPDIAMLAAGGAIVGGVMQMTIVRTVREALGRLKRGPKDKTRFGPPAEQAILWGYGVSVSLFALFIMLAVFTGGGPEWAQFIRDMI